MANLGTKGGIYHVRFRFQNREYKKSLKTRIKSDAEAARRSVEQTIHRLLVGLLAVPPDVDPGDFILSGGTLTRPIPHAEPVRPPDLPPTKALIEEYKESQKNVLAPSYHYTQALHLRHLVRHLGDLADAPCDRVGHRDLDRYLKARLAARHPITAERERITLLQFYKWVVRQGYLPASPADGLTPIKGGEDRPPFRTVAEIDRVIERGGLTAADALDLWECLYLSPEEIAGLLATVRVNAHVDYAFLLHAIPAYTGVRRGELLRLQWVDLDLDEDCLYARSRKQSRRKKECVRRIDLHAELKKELLAWRERRPRGQYVICEATTLEPINNDQANRCFRRPMRHTEWCLDNARNWFKIGFHTYRHSFASNLAAAGIDQRVIDEWMGHQTLAMRKRYQHLFPKDRRSAIASFSLSSVCPGSNCPPDAGTCREAQQG
jgi:integrase